MAPPVCLVIPFYLIYAKIGLLDTFVGLSLVYMTFDLSFYVWVLRSFCRDLPAELEEAAILEGWSKPQVFWRVVCRSPGFFFCRTPLLPPRRNLPRAPRSRAGAARRIYPSLRRLSCLTLRKSVD
jgi:hypothetical protein